MPCYIQKVDSKDGGKLYTKSTTKPLELNGENIPSLAYSSQEQAGSEIRYTQDSMRSDCNYSDQEFTVVAGNSRKRIYAKTELPSSASSSGDDEISEEPDNALDGDFVPNEDDDDDDDDDDTSFSDGNDDDDEGGGDDNDDDDDDDDDDDVDSSYREVGDGNDRIETLEQESRRDMYVLDIHQLIFYLFPRTDFPVAVVLLMERLKQYIIDVISVDIHAKCLTSGK
jgi:hypothetical protein